MTQQEFLDALDERIRERFLLNHPFYKMWMEGVLPLSALQGYAGQYWHQVWNFPQYLSALHARTDDPVVRRELVVNLAEEEGQDVTHPELWLRFAEGIGASRAEVQASVPLPETSGLVQSFRYIARNGSWHEAVAAFYAYESQVPEIACSKVDGLKKNYDIQDADTTAYFTLHAEMDVEHAAAWRKLLADGCTDEASRKVAIDAAGRAADALWGLLDGIQQSYVQESGGGSNLSA